MNLNQIIFTTPKIEESKAFYGKLGLELIVDSPDYLRFASAKGEATFSLARADSASSGASLYFEHECLDEWVTELQTKGLMFAELPTDKPYLWREATLFDPGGNKVVLYWAGENRLNPPWRVNKLGPAFLEAVSE